MDYDHMLNGRGSRQHHQNMIKDARYNTLIKDAKKHVAQQQGVSTTADTNIRLGFATILNIFIK